MEEYTFSTALETALPMGIKVAAVPMDEHGLRPDALDDILSNWDEGPARKKPYLLYMVPTGQNPTGSTQPLARRKAIYEIAGRHDLYIVEDEPYYYLQLPPYTPPTPTPDHTPDHTSHLQRDELIPSYLSLDTSGRVLRLDSLSKVLAPGCRTGWITASEQVIDKFVRHNEISAQNPSGFSQVIVYTLLNHQWGHKGFLSWLVRMQEEYTWRRDVFVSACDKYLPGDVAWWVPARAGMFVRTYTSWIRCKVANVFSNGSRLTGRLIRCSRLAPGMPPFSRRYSLRPCRKRCS
jgi:aromatic amino acid aminotransferase I / 2-aminoadipate transaminase